MKTILPVISSLVLTFNPNEFFVKIVFYTQKLLYKKIYPLDEKYYFIVIKLLIEK